LALSEISTESVTVSAFFLAFSNRFTVYKKHKYTDSNSQIKTFMNELAKSDYSCTLEVCMGPLFSDWPSPSSYGPSLAHCHSRKIKPSPVSAYLKYYFTSEFERYLYTHKVQISEHVMPFNKDLHKLLLQVCIPFLEKVENAIHKHHLSLYSCFNLTP